MKIIVDEVGEIIAKASDDNILIGGHHRLAVAASLGKRVFWRDTGEPVKISFSSIMEVLLDIQPEPFAQLSDLRTSRACAHKCAMSASLIGRLGSSAFRLSIAAV